jgi:hypothetical protein
MCVYIYAFLFPLLYYNYSFIYLYKGYASYIHISRGYVKHKRLRTTGLEYIYYAVSFGTGLRSHLQLIVCYFPNRAHTLRGLPEGRRDRQVTRKATLE